MKEMMLLPLVLYYLHYSFIIVIGTSSLAGCV
jgi:hypothetical protein